MQPKDGSLACLHRPCTYFGQLTEASLPVSFKKFLTGAHFGSLAELLRPCPGQSESLSWIPGVLHSLDPFELCAQWMPCASGAAAVALAWAPRSYGADPSRCKLEKFKVKPNRPRACDSGQVRPVPVTLDETSSHYCGGHLQSHCHGDPGSDSDSACLPSRSR